MTKEKQGKVVTNGQPRDIIYGWQLTATERKEFDYHDWIAIDSGGGSASFFRYKGQLYDLGEFTGDFGITKGSGLPEHLSKWDGYMSLHAFAAMLIKYTDNDDSVIVGHIYS
jgi:hypothetical protein